MGSSDCLVWYTSKHCELAGKLDIAATAKLSASTCSCNWLASDTGAQERVLDVYNCLPGTCWIE